LGIPILASNSGIGGNWNSGSDIGILTILVGKLSENVSGEKSRNWNSDGIP
jgi:hypothetical protein